MGAKRDKKRPSKDNDLSKRERKKSAKFRYKFKVESLRAECMSLLEENEYLRKVIIENLPPSASESILKECCMPHPSVNNEQTTTKSLEVMIEELVLVDNDDKLDQTDDPE